MKNLLRVSLFLGVSLTTVLAAAKFTQSGGGSAAFTAKGPGGLKIEGKTTDVTAGESDGKLSVAVDLTKLDTGIELRNEHMRKALETDKCPKATLVVARDQLSNPGDGEEKSGEANGQLTLHCQTKPVKVSYKAKNAGGVRSASGTTNINMKDFGIEPPTYAGVGVKPDVAVSVNFAVKDE